MLKLIQAVTAVAAVIGLAGCGDSTAQPDNAQAADAGWRYEYAEDKLRQQAIVTAWLASNEWIGDNPLLTLRVTKGSQADEVVIASAGQYCGSENLIRVDSYPIEHLPCDGQFGFLSRIALDSELGQRIVASSEVVIERSGPMGMQASFETRGLNLSPR